MNEVIHMSERDIEAAEMWHYSRGDTSLDAIARALNCNIAAISYAISKHLALVRDHIQRERELARTN